MSIPDSPRSSPAPAPGSPTAPSPSPKPPQANRTVGLILVILFILLFVMVMALVYIFRSAAGERARADLPDPQAPLRDLRARETGLLESYGYVDREKGVVRIPITRAMQLETRQPWHEDFPTTKTP